MTATSIGQSYDIDLILPDLLYDEMDGDELIQLLPPQYTGAAKVKWEQKENLYGLLPLRGLGGEPSSVQLTGYRQYEMTPGYYGAFTELDETELTLGREPGTAADPVSVAERVKDMMLLLSGMTVNQVKQSIATVLSTGKVINRSADGRITHAAQIENFNSYSPANDGNTGPGWAASPTTATPVKDLLYWQNQLQLGTSTKFGGDSRLLCQRGVVNDLLATSSIQSTFRSKFGATINGEEDLNKLLIGFGLPALTVYDEGYYATLAAAQARDKSQFTRFLAAKTLIWVGNRPKGQMLGQFQLTRNLYKEPLVGAGVDGSTPNPVVGKYGFEQGLYNLLRHFQGPPLKYRYDVGFNGGVTVRYPSMVAGLSYT